MLSKLPNSFGNYIYHQLQKRSEHSNTEQKISTNTSSFKVTSRILQQNNISIKDKNVIEIGSGWVPIFPYLLSLISKVNNVKSYDINEHFSGKQISEVNKYYADYEGFKLLKNGKYNLLHNVEYFPNQDVVNANFANVDLVYSRFVLEHIHPKILIGMHEAFAAKMKKGSHILHLISPSDHRAYTDSRLSMQDFLKYSTEEWDSIQTRFDYHNRLRLPQYLEIFSKHFEIVSVEHDLINPESLNYKKFKELKIHTDFQKYTEQELMAGSINILLRKK